MIPHKTLTTIGVGQWRQCLNRVPEDDYIVGHTDLRDLAALAVRLNSKMEGDELRDWQNRLNLIITSALPSRGGSIA